jgi:hypothetical protein
VRFTESNGDVDVVLIFGRDHDGGTPLISLDERRRRMFHTEPERAYRVGQADTIVAIRRALSPVLITGDGPPAIDGDGPAAIE